MKTEKTFYVLRRGLENHYFAAKRSAEYSRWLNSIPEATQFQTIRDAAWALLLSEKGGDRPEIIRVTEKLQSGSFTLSTDVQPQPLQDNKYVIVGLHSLTIGPHVAFWNGVSFGPIQEAKQFGSELEAVEYLIAKETRVHGPCGIRRVVAQTLRKEYVEEVVQ